MKQLNMGMKPRRSKAKRNKAGSNDLVYTQQDQSAE